MSLFVKKLFKVAMQVFGVESWCSRRDLNAPAAALSGLRGTRSHLGCMPGALTAPRTESSRCVLAEYSLKLSKVWNVSLAQMFSGPHLMKRHQLYQE